MDVVMVDSKVNTYKVVKGYPEQLGQLDQGPKAWEITTGLPVIHDTVRVDVEAFSYLPRAPPTRKAESL